MRCGVAACTPEGNHMTTVSENDRTETKRSPKPKEAAGPAYDANAIRILEGLEAVRVRPGMYIGSTDVRGLHHLVYETVDNSVDEVLNGGCTHIEIVIQKDGSVRNEDNGRGIPVDEHPQRPGVSTLEVVMTTLHAGGKFGGEGYKMGSGGLHGVGVSAVNALSEYCRVEVKRDGKLYAQEYRQGIPQGPVKVVGKSQGTGHHHHLQARPHHHGDGRFQLRHPRPALPRDGLPEPWPHDLYER